MAANLSGPRRVAWGAMRDHVLGVRAVNGQGELIRSGGRVLKNVTGLDLCKLLAGSHGTLAVLTEITLKVLPAPERRGTVVLRGLDAGAGRGGAVGRARLALRRLRRRLSAGRRGGAVPALAWLGGPVAMARIEDFSAVRRLSHRPAARRSGEVRHAPKSWTTRRAVAAWAAVRDAVPLHGETGAIWRVSVRPSAGPAVAAAVAQAFGARWFLDWGGGLVWIAGPADRRRRMTR